MCKSRNFPRHPVIPPEVWCFWHIFGGSNTFSTGAPGCLGFVLKVGSFENFKYHDPTKMAQEFGVPVNYDVFYADSKDCGLVLEPDLEDTCFGGPEKSS